MIFLNEYVAPWALTKGVIPFHLVWEPENSLTKICVELPENYNIMDTLNFSEYSYNENNGVLTVLKDDLKSDNYFGIVTSYMKIIEYIERLDDIDITFFGEDDKVLSQKILKTRIVRPKLEILDYPKSIEIEDKTNLNNLINLKILHKGIGTAHIDIKVSHEERDISVMNSLFWDILLKMYDEISKDIYDESIIDNDYAGIDEDLLKKTTEALLDQAKNKELLLNLSEEQRRLVTNVINDKNKIELLYRAVFANLNNIFLSALLYYNDRYPVESIRLLYGNMAVKLSEKIDDMTINIEYSDSLNNIYPSEDIHIMVYDKRIHEPIVKDIEIPVNISWKKDLLNLEI